ncbi:MAG: replicative DNA helicase [Spirochaetales bacterium]|nr:replicative DNA helicase [Spirochaetales bacterium]MCF7937484.1 replicative DNA helicase [Spirochaetales bacterium]
MDGLSRKGIIPPHNIEAERAVLGAVLLDSDSITTVLQYLRAEDFYKTSHRRVFSAAIQLFDRSEAIDLLTISDELSSQGYLSDVGGADYVASLVDQVPTSANVEFYAKIVQSSSIRRRMLKIAEDINADAFDESKDSRLLIEEAERRIFEVTDLQHSAGYRAAREILPATIEAIEKLYQTKKNYTGVPAGFDDLDALTSGFQQSEMVILGARPSIGKTALALTMAANIAIRQSIPVGFFTLEMSEQALMQRLLSMEARLDSNRLRTGLLKQSDFQSILEASGRIYEAPLFIDDTPSMKLLDLRAQARRMKAQEDLQIIFVDYITLVTAENTELPRHEQIAETSRSLKALARELQIPIVVLSQLRRETEGKRPTLADIRESGSIEQDADVVLFLHRDRSGEDDEETSPSVIETELIVGKQRNGPIGTLKLAFLPRYTKFEALSYETA